MRRRMLTRCCVLLLAGILLMVQAPWAHAMPSAGADAAHAAAAEVPPCHGEAPAAPRQPADGCCDGIHCDGHCAHPAWAAAAVLQVGTVLQSLPPASRASARWSGVRPEKLLRPPI